MVDLVPKEVYFNFKSHKRTLSVSSGSASDTTIFLNNLMKFVVIEPSTDTTNYDFNLTDDDGIIILERESRTGRYGVLLDLPLLGKVTINILNSTKDEAFAVKLVYQ